MRLKDTCGEVRRGIRYRSAAPSAESAAEALRACCEEEGIPAIISIDRIHESGLLGKSYDCVVITHPDPPQSYYSHVIVINQNILSFYFYGYSDAVAKQNKKERLSNSSSLFDNIRGGLMRESQMDLDLETAWYTDLCEVYENVFD